MAHWASQPLPHYLRRTSYSLFLVHFPILLLSNVLFTELGFSGAAAGGICMLAAWATSLYTANLFYRWIEKPATGIKAQTVADFWNMDRLVRLRFRLAATTFWVLAIPV